MRKLLYTFIFLLSGIVAQAQTVRHIQSAVVGHNYIPYGEDSALTITYVTGSKDYRMVVFNRKTLQWRYLNQQSYHIRPGQNGIVMQDLLKGISSQHDNTILYTADGWKTAKTASGIAANSVVASKSGFVATNMGNTTTFYFSADGETWKESRDAIFGTYFTRAYGDHVVAIRNLQEILVSRDGGQSFSDLQNQNHPPVSMTDFWMPDTAVLYITDRNGKLWRSTNTGKTWSDITLPSTGKIAFKNAAEGVLMDLNRVVYFTADSGKTWQQSNAVFPDVNYIQPYYLGDYLYFGTRYRTADQGKTFEPVFHQIPNIEPHDIHFNKKGVGLLTGGNGLVHLSKDNGVTFIILEKKPSNEDLMAVHVLSNNTLLVADRRGQIFVSKDMGESWSQKNTEVSNWNGRRFDVSADEKTIVLRRLGQPMISTDGGETFEMNMMGGGNHDHAVAPNGTIYDASNYNNGGNTDSLEIHTVDPEKKQKNSILRIHSPQTVITKIYMASNNTGYVMGSNSTNEEVIIFRTDDAWKSVKPATKIVSAPGAYSSFFSMYNFGNDTLVLVPHGRKFYHYTTNGGQSWTADTFRLWGKTIERSTMGSHFFRFGNFMLGVDNNEVLVNNTMEAIDTSTISIRENNNKRLAEISLYPNPARNYIHLELVDLQPKTGLLASIFDISGRLVSTHQLSQSQTINVENLQKGLYIIHIYKHGKMLGQAKFIKQ